jgi:hypothetical protein
VLYNELSPLIVILELFLYPKKSNLGISEDLYKFNFNCSSTVFIILRWFGDFSEMLGSLCSV